MTYTYQTVAFCPSRRLTVEYYFDLKGEANLHKNHYSRMGSMADLSKFEKGGMIDQMTAVPELNEHEEDQ